MGRRRHDLVVRASHCANCGTSLQGEWCHHCGQSVHSALRHLPEMVGDAAEMLLQLDGRVLRTLPTLYLFPGRLTREYLAGHRVRYVTPFRLMFVLCLICFFFMQMSLHIDADNGTRTDAAVFAAARTPAAVFKALTQRRSQVQQHGLADRHVLVAGRLVVVAGNALDRAALARLRQLQHGQPLPAALRPALQNLVEQLLQSADSPQTVQRTLGEGLQLLAGGDGQAGDATSTQREALLGAAGRRLAALQAREQRQPLTTTAPSWLPAAAHTYLQHLRTNMRDNAERLSSDDPRERQRVIGHMFSALPQSMLVMVPLFALLLQLLYLFRRRLYMEHLIVALHSHAFLFLSLLLLLALSALRGWAPGWLALPLGVLMTATIVWMPTYLLLMQKRVYAQGWPLTVFKYLVTGMIYLFLLSLTVAAAMVIGLAD